MNEKKVYTVDEVAELLSTSPARVREFISGKKLKALKIGRYLVRAQDLDDFLADNVGLDVINGGVCQ